MRVFFVQAEDGIRCLGRSRGLGDVYKRQVLVSRRSLRGQHVPRQRGGGQPGDGPVMTTDGDSGPTRTLLTGRHPRIGRCLLYTSDAADERSSVDLGGRRLIKKKNKTR